MDKSLIFIISYALRNELINSAYKTVKPTHYNQRRRARTHALDLQASAQTTRGIFVVYSLMHTHEVDSRLGTRENAYILINCMRMPNTL